jgi:hypothetical protein
MGQFEFALMQENQTKRSKEKGTQHRHVMTGFSNSIGAKFFQKLI